MSLAPIADAAAFLAAAAEKPKPREIPIPRLGCSILIRCMTGSEKDAFEDSLNEKRGKKTERNLKNFRARLIAEVAIKPDGYGSKLFTADQVEQLGQAHVCDIEPIFDAACEMNGFTKSDVEAITKNSEAGPAAGSC